MLILSDLLFSLFYLLLFEGCKFTKVTSQLAQLVVRLRGVLLVDAEAIRHVVTQTSHLLNYLLECFLKDSFRDTVAAGATLRSLRLDHFSIFIIFVPLASSCQNIGTTSLPPRGQITSPLANLSALPATPTHTLLLFLFVVAKKETVHLFVRGVATFLLHEGRPCSHCWLILHLFELLAELFVLFVNIEGLNGFLASKVIQDQHQGARQVLQDLLFDLFLSLIRLLVRLNEVIGGFKVSHHVLEHLVVPTDFHGRHCFFFFF